MDQIEKTRKCMTNGNDSIQETGIKMVDNDNIKTPQIGTAEAMITSPVTHTIENQKSTPRDQRQQRSQQQQPYSSFPSSRNHRQRQPSHHLYQPERRPNPLADILSNLDPDRRAVYAFLSDTTQQRFLDEGPFHPSWTISYTTPGDHQSHDAMNNTTQPSTLLAFDVSHPVWMRRNSIEFDPTQFSLNDIDLNVVLLRAVFLDNLSIVDICLANNADIQFRDESGRTALHYASAAGLPGMTQYVITRLKRKRNTYDENYQPSEEYYDNPIPTSSTDSSECPSGSSTEKSIAPGINDRDIKGWTPLQIAVCKDLVDVARVLLSEGADLNMLYNHNCTPCRETPTHSKAIHFSAMRCNIEMLQLLRQWGANAEDPDDCDRHPLHYATARGRIEFIKELLSVAPNSVHALDRHRRSPVHVAALRGFPEIIRLFYTQYNIDLTQRDAWDLDPYSLSVTAGHVNTASALKELLEKQGINVPNCDPKNGKGVCSLNNSPTQLELSQLEKTVLDVLIAGLQESDQEQLARCVFRLGSEMCLSMYRRTLEIQEQGGILTSDKTRKKSAGGVFLGILQEKVRSGEINKGDWTYIRAVVLERQRVKKGQTVTNNHDENGAPNSSFSEGHQPSGFPARQSKTTHNSQERFKQNRTVPSETTERQQSFRYRQPTNSRQAVQRANDPIQSLAQQQQLPSFARHYSPSADKTGIKTSPMEKALIPSTLSKTVQSVKSESLCPNIPFTFDKTANHGRRPMKTNMSRIANNQDSGQSQQQNTISTRGRVPIDSEHQGFLAGTTLTGFRHTMNRFVQKQEEKATFAESAALVEKRPTPNHLDRSRVSTSCWPTRAPSENRLKAIANTKPKDGQQKKEMYEVAIKRII